MDLSRAILVANLYRHPLNHTTAAWVNATFTPERQYGLPWDRLDLIAFRNRAVRDVVLVQPAEIEWAVFVDNDVTITHPGVDEFLKLTADVASCRCPMPPGTEAWRTANAFHTTFWFARIEVFRAMAPPWFEFRYSVDGCEMLACECQVFAEKVRAAGFTVAHGGRCGHACEGKWCG